MAGPDINILETTVISHGRSINDLRTRLLALERAAMLRDPMPPRGPTMDADGCVVLQPVVMDKLRRLADDVGELLESVAEMRLELPPTSDGADPAINLRNRGVRNIHKAAAKLLKPEMSGGECVPVRIMRDGQWTTADLHELSDADLADFSARQPAWEGWTWARNLARRLFVVTATGTERT